MEGKEYVRKKVEYEDCHQGPHPLKDVVCLGAPDGVMASMEQRFGEKLRYCLCERHTVISDARIANWAQEGQGQGNNLQEDGSRYSCVECVDLYAGSPIIIVCGRMYGEQTIGIFTEGNDEPVVVSMYAIATALGQKPDEDEDAEYRMVPRERMVE